MWHSSISDDFYDDDWYEDLTSDERHFCTSVFIFTPEELKARDEKLMEEAFNAAIKCKWANLLPLVPNLPITFKDWFAERNK